MKRVLVAIALMASSSFVIADEVKCLAQNIYWEARNQSIQGMYAVADVTLNRVKDKRWPSTVCEVVKQRKNAGGRWVCQFSWYCDGKSDEPLDTDTFFESYVVAQDVLMGKYPDITEGATHYHSIMVDPYWASSLNETVQITDHIFYK